MLVSPEVEAHDRPRRKMARNNPESGARKRRSVAGRGAAGAQLSIERICLNRRCAGQLRCLERLGNQSRRYTPPPVALAHIKARDRPDRDIIHPLQPPLPVEPWQRVARRKLTPSNGQIAIECNQPWRRPRLHYFQKCSLVLLGRQPAVRAPNAPVHAPAAAAWRWRSLAEQRLKRRP